MLVDGKVFPVSDEFGEGVLVGELDVAVGGRRLSRAEGVDVALGVSVVEERRELLTITQAIHGSTVELLSSVAELRRHVRNLGLEVMHTT